MVTMWHPVTVRNSVRPLAGTRSEFATRDKFPQDRRFQLDKVVCRCRCSVGCNCVGVQDERNIITILAPSDRLHSPPLEVGGAGDRSSPFFPPTTLSYYAAPPPPPPALPVYTHIGPSLPPTIIKYYPAPAPVPAPAPAPARPSADPISDRVDTAALSLVSAVSSLPSVLGSVVVPLLAAGSAVWLSQNVPTPVVHERRHAPGHTHTSKDDNGLSVDREKLD